MANHSKTSRFSAALTVMALLALSSAHATNEIVWAGCAVTKKAFMAEIAAAYERKTGVKLKLEGGGATKGIRYVASKKVDAGGSCRHRLFVDGTPVGTELRTTMHQVAWDAIAVITHPEVGVTNITTANLRKVYNGVITNWKDLGGPDAPLVLVTREGKYSGVEQMFRVLMFGDQTYDYLARTVDASDSSSLEDYVEKTPYSLGVDGVSSARKSHVTILALDHIEPSKINIAAGRYPLFRPLYLVTGPNPTSAVSDLVAFTLSVEGQRIIAEQGTVNLEEGRALVEPWNNLKQRFGG